MPAPSLVEISKRVCIKNVSSLTDVGAVEYFLIKDVLEHVRHTDQLRQIELNSPQIKGDDADLWRKFIAKEVPDWYKKNYAPKNPTKWYEVYCKYKNEQAAEIKRDEEILREQMMGLKKIRETNVSKIVDLKQLPKIPRDPRMLANNGGVPLGKKGFKKEGPSSLVFSSGSKTKITDGKSVLTKARREAKEIAQMSKLSRPTHQLAGRLGQVSRAPAGMVKAYQTASQPAGRPLSSIKILSRKPALTDKFQAGSTSSLEDREKRLRALTMGGSKGSSSVDPKATLVGSSDDEDELEDLFDDRSAPSSPPKRAHPASSPPSVISRPVAKPMSVLQQLAKPRPNPATASSPPTPKPSPGPSAITSSPPSRPSSAPPRPRLSPTMAAAPKPSIMKRKPVDIFNRGPKRPRHA